MEDWAFHILETLNANQQLDMLRVLGPRYDIDAENATRAMLALPEWAELNSLAYMHTVIPNLRNLGLITERTEGAYRRLGMLVERRAGVPVQGSAERAVAGSQEAGAGPPGGIGAGALPPAGASGASAVDASR